MQQASSPEDQGGQPEQRERILIVDDESAIRGLVEELLQRSGYDVTAVANAEGALQYLQGDPACGLVLADVMMPGTGGISLLDAICREHPGLPVVMITAVHDVQV